MSGSVDFMDKQFIAWLKEIRPKNLYDIGAGSGKIGIITRDNLPGCQTTAIEVYLPYVEKYSLCDKYDCVWMVNALEIMKQTSFLADCVVFGDSLEHMPRSDGADLLDFLVIRSKHVGIIYPVHTEDAPLYQPEVNGNIREAHVSIWTEADFARYDYKYRESGPMRFVTIRGYR